MKHTKIYNSVTSALCLSVVISTSQSAHAEEQSVERINITANKNELMPSLSNQVVITEQDIAVIQPSSVVELLQMVSGIDFSQQGGKGQLASLFFRGTNANHVSIIIDGVKLGSATLGSADIQQISPEQIERIEIVKGPRAAVWGSDAIGGVIQIFTKQSSQLAAKAMAGTNNFIQMSVLAGLSYQDGQINVSVNREESEGFDVLKEAELDDDGYQQTSMNIRGQHIVNPSWSVDYTVNSIWSDSEYDNAWGGNNESEIENYAWNLSATRQTDSNAFTQVSVAQNQDNNKNFSVQWAPNGVTEFTTTRDQVSLLHFEQISEEFGLQAGIDWHNESVSGTTVYDINERVLYAVYGQSSLSIDKQTIELALRYDNIENIDSELTYNLGWGTNLNEFGKLALTYGTGFKAPTFNDLYYPVDMFSGGNAELKSERSTSIELNWSKNWQNQTLSISAYDSTIDELIEWQADQNYFYQPVNVASASIEGIEVDYSLYGLGGKHQISFAHIDAKDSDTGLALIRRAKQQFAYSYARQFDDISLIAQYQYRGERDDLFFNMLTFTTDRTVLDAYQLINVTLSYQLNDNVLLDLKATNLLDEDYVTAYGYRTAGQSVYVGVRYR